MAEIKAVLEKEFYARIPKARKINPVFRALFDFMYEAHLLAKPGKKLLNIYASQDFSGNREEVYRDKFFKECEYEAIDFWKDHFIRDDKPTEQAHVLPFSDQSFDIIVTTKYIMEHVSEPEKVISEFHRVLKPGGEAFVTAALVRRQHQAPYDYYRFTEYALDYLFKKVGFDEVKIIPTNGSIATLGSYSYFFQRGLNMPNIMERFCNWIYYWIIEPIAYFIDRFDNGYGRDLSLYFLVRAKRK
ncbi:hypothetical protein A3B18_02790 [Candidatus Giovannonibacteria bacterium RIFCSPLOWO2_01_FULL_46_13]|uniref:Methyltransferase type 11 domain-containing protein n=1 Tax=Candidatus Giovannonibacteria bacterium RIFCSPLOWO2_01_FULL_46_13 TaxID=1798352 RepID=A0A1F5X3R3_9BACT|nr:MAG: hypothetical protein A3B18_02790 [Candidatus Giovannonibacteria bacterium RIFCSPLOWO2_01_FULL_46_13]